MMKIRKYNKGGEVTNDGLEGLGVTGAYLGQLSGLAIDATSRKIDSKYGNHLKDPTQGTGRAIGSTVGQAADLLVPGLGAIAGPVLGSVGAGLQKSLQGGKLKKVKKQVDLQEATDTFNEGIDNTDLTSTQKAQYPDGVKKVKLSPTVGESTKVARPVKPNLVKSVKDIKDPQTQQFLKTQMYNDNDVYSKEQDRLRLLQHVKAGNPKVRSSDSRSQYNMFTNTLNLQRPSDYTQELAHSIQNKQGNLGTRTVKDWVKSPYVSARGYNKQYDIPGSVEHEAHGKMQEDIVMATDRQTAVKNVKALKKASYSKGVKIIEIEGKKTPEIHTDKDFNVKNLGITPHSKGGDKVLAEEGDVVFPTQDSPRKYNEVMTAIKTKDMSKLKKIQSALPDDKLPTYRQGGTVDGDKKPKKETMADIRARAAARRQETMWGPLDNWFSTKTAPLLKANKKVATQPVTTTSAQPKTNELPALGTVKAPKSTTKVAPKNPTARKVAPSIVKQRGAAVDTVKAFQTASGLTGRDVDGIYGAKTAAAGSRTLAGKLDKSVGNLDGLDNRTDYAKAEDAYDLERQRNGSLGKQAVSSTPTPDKPKGFMDRLKGKLGSTDGNTAMELAPVAYNIGQGLFGNVEKVDRKFHTPTLEKYTDTSDPLRSKSAALYSQDKANSRSMSGGVAGNSRSNQQAASNSEFERQSSINNQEIGKALQVDSMNARTKNHSGMVNLQLKNQYDEVDAANRGAKSAMLTQGLNALGAIGVRNKIEANKLAAHKVMAQGAASNTVYDESYFEDGLFKVKPPVKKKGVKSIKK